MVRSIAASFSVLDDKDDSVRKNAETIIHYSTAYPFRMNEKSIRCVYCHEQFTDPEVFRMHMDDDHRKFSLRLAFHNIPKAEYIKADLSDLRCRLCDEKLNDLEETALHLNTVHRKEVDTSANIGVMPFKLGKEQNECAICQKIMPSLTILIRHTITHFLAHTCSVCGSNYLTETAMIRHMRHKHQSYAVTCKICGQEFSTVEEKLRHQKVGNRCLPYPCSDCPERFMDWKTKMHHMALVHDRGTKEFRCDDCSLIFAEEKEYYLHRRLEHSEMSVACHRCGLKFTSGYALKRHQAEKCD